MNVLKIEHLKKSFGSNEVIRDVSLEVPAHTIYGFLGQNGAGKTTTMKIILGLLKADAGMIQVCGEAVHYGETKTNRHIGYLPDVPEFYNYMKPMEYMQLCGEITGLTAADTKKRSNDLLELMGLADVNRRIGGFSRGMKQRLGVAQALLNEPALLICDEPTSALDPVGRKEILDILLQARAHTTILFSTHILADAERICDRAAVLHEGKLVRNGTIQELKKNGRLERLQIEFAEAETMQRFLADWSCLDGEKIEVVGRTILLTSRAMEASHRRVLMQVVKLDIIPRVIERQDGDLESLFMEVVA